MPCYKASLVYNLEFEFTIFLFLLATNPFSPVPCLIYQHGNGWDDVYSTNIVVLSYGLTCQIYAYRFRLLLIGAITTGYKHQWKEWGNDRSLIQRTTRGKQKFSYIYIYILWSLRTSARATTSQLMQIQYCDQNEYRWVRPALIAWLICCSQVTKGYCYVMHMIYFG